MIVNSQSGQKGIVSFQSGKKKQNFIHMLGNHLVEKGCNVIHAEGDADLMITKTAVKSAEEQPTVVVGGYTNLVILQCLYANVSHQEILSQTLKLD